MHEVQALAPFGYPKAVDFLWRRRCHTLSCLFLNENHELSRSTSRQIDLLCVVSVYTRVIYSPTGVSHRLLAWLTSTPACTNSFCPSWWRCRSPSKTTKLVQISIGLPERTSKKCSYWKNQLSTWTLIFEIVCENVCACLDFALQRLLRVFDEFSKSFKVFFPHRCNCFTSSCAAHRGWERSFPSSFSDIFPEHSGVLRGTCKCICFVFFLCLATGA